MKHVRLFVLILSILLCLSACGESRPAFQPIDSNTETESVTESESESEAETEPAEPKKRVAITYDDGPAFDNDTVQRLTYKLADEFAKYGGAATFFVVGNRINAKTGAAIQYAYSKGCEYAIHAYTHDIYFDECPENEYLNELKQTKAAIQKYIDADITLLRAPGGYITKERAILGGYPIINWSIDTEDWRHKSRADDETIAANVNAIVENALRGVEDGDIILMHEIYQNTYEATCIILARLHEMGFEFVTVTELIGEENLIPGETYYCAP